MTIASTVEPALALIGRRGFGTSDSGAPFRGVIYGDDFAVYEG